MQSGGGGGAADEAVVLSALPRMSADNATAGDIAAAARSNRNFRRVIVTTERSQVVLMHLRKEEQLGFEVHPGTDQIFYFVAGSGTVALGNPPEYKPVSNGHLVVVPAGTVHNVIQHSYTDDELGFITIYAPPHHPPGTVHRTKADADRYESERAPEDSGGAAEQKRKRIGNALVDLEIY